MGSCYGTITVATLVIQDCFVGLLFALMPLFKQATRPISALASLVPPVFAESAPTSATSETHRFGSWGRLRRMTASEDLSVRVAPQGRWNPDGQRSDGVGAVIIRWLQETAESPAASMEALDHMHSSEPQQGFTALVAVARVVLKIGLFGAASLLLARIVLSYPLKLLAR